jgi:hypothetical protein
MPRGGPPRLAFACAALALHARAAAAATYAVGPGRPFPDLQSVAPVLKPGDRVEIEGGVTYPGGVVFREAGRAKAPITIAGMRVGGRRPVIAGGATTIEVRADHYVLEGLDITGGTARCLYHHADDVAVRDTVVHDCPGHGVLSADSDSGSLTLEYVEVARAGRGDGAHPIYVATDEEAFPRSVFRMEHCFVHDGTGGNNVKSRAERNEIYSNWIEGARYHELELVGPDGAERKRAREDSDVVGNVLRKTGPGWAIRVGGDGSGETLGRYRFVNNTIVLAPSASGAFRLFDGLESIEMHNNAIVREGGGPVRVLVEQEVRWASGRRVIAGSRNWVPLGSMGVPPEWTRTLTGMDPGLASPSDPRPLEGSPLIGAGALDPAGPLRFAFPAPLVSPRHLPPPGALERVGTAIQRLRGSTDIGAFSFGAPPPATPTPTPSVATGAPPEPAVPVPAPPVPPRAPSGGCACRAAAFAHRCLHALVAAIAAGALVPLRRRGRVR